MMAWLLVGFSRASKSTRMSVESISEQKDFKSISSFSCGSGGSQMKPTIIPNITPNYTKFNHLSHSNLTTNSLKFNHQYEENSTTPKCHYTKMSHHIIQITSCEFCRKYRHASNCAGNKACSVSMTLISAMEIERSGGLMLALTMDVYDSRSRSSLLLLGSMSLVVSSSSIVVVMMSGCS